MAAVCLLALTLLSLPQRAAADEVCDEFPTHSAAWSLRVPQCGPTLSLTDRDGYARFHVPDGITASSDFDSWAGPDRAPSLERTDMGAGDWTISTRLEFETPPTGTNYHAGLVVYFGPRANNDAVFWGEYTGNGSLGIERSGNNIRPTYVSDPGPVSLQIEKIGNSFFFRHRTDDGAAWIDDVMYTTETGQPLATEDPVTSVGLIVKTWGGGTSPDVLADFDYFCLETPDLVPTPGVNDAIPPSSPVSSLDCTRNGDGSIDLAWVTCDGNENETTIRIAGELVRTVPASTTSATLTPPFPGGSIVTVVVDNGFGRPVSCTLARALRDVCDEFDEDPLASGDWNLRLPFEPASPPTINVDDNPGFLRFRAPSAGEAGQHFDNWSGVDLAPSLERYDMGDLDWTISTRLSFPEEFAVPGDAHHVGLMLGYGRGAPDDAYNDVTYWGQYRTAGVLKVERTGAAITPEIPHDGAPVSLQIQKSGSSVTFSHRKEDSDPWTTDAQYTIQLPYPANAAASPPAGTPVSRVGLIIKTWGGGAPEVVADFDYFCLTVLDSPPIASINATPLTGVAPLEVTFSAAESIDPSGGTLTHGWDFGDGSADGSGVEVRHTYTRGGIFTATLTSTDDENNAGSTTQELMISDDPAPLAWSRLGNQGGEGVVFIDRSGAVPVHCLNVGGSSLSGTTDNAYFLNQSLSGDFVVRARLTAETFTGIRVRAGLVARSSLDPRAPNAAILVDPADDGYTFQVRRTEGQSYQRTGGPVDPPRNGFPAWLQLERQGNVFIGSYSMDGVTYTEYSRTDVEALNLPSLFVGLAATSGDPRARLQVCAELDFGNTPPPDKQFHRGDADQNGSLQLTDAIQILSYLFLGTATRVPECLDASDADDNGVIQLTDAIRILGFLFLGSAAPAPPGPPPEPCGADPTADEMPNEECVYQGC